jgi:arylsulfatase A-like enzyme
VPRVASYSRATELRSVGPRNRRGRRHGWIAGLCALALVVVVGCAADRLGVQWSVSDSPVRAIPEVPVRQVERLPLEHPVIQPVAFEPDPVEVRPAATAQPFVADLSIAGNQEWGDTGIDVVAQEPLTIRADGTISAGRSAKGNYDDATQVGPEGTFLYSEKIQKNNFPLASAGSGPAPCFCLIGRIGNSQPFFIGRGRSWKPAESGRLYLGINDFDVSDNTGAFVAHIEKTPAVQPIAYEDFVPIDVTPGAPVPGGSIVVFYIDGLRPDVVKEMAAMGHLPNINRLFIEGGVWMSNAFTGFPSDTITSNGTMWTGCFSDRHGLKGQVSFSRRTLESKSYLDLMGPSRSARQLAPQGLDRLLNEAGKAGVETIDGEEASRRWLARQTTGVPPIYEHLRHNGSDWATGALPVMNDFPPATWSRSLTKYVPYLQYHKSWRYIDEANADYARNFLFERKSPVTMIWLPETDSVSHHDYSRGQFGTTRRTIARADVLIGQMLEEIAGRGEFDRTYFVLCSDHGHHGGRTTHLAHFDIANEFFYKPRMVSTDGAWVGGGLGLSVRQHRIWNKHPEDKSVNFVWLDADSDGAGRIFLPNQFYKSGQWYNKPRPGDLLAYRIADSVAPVNLIGSLTAVQAVHSDGTTQHPIDLVLAKLTNDSILISTQDRGNAVILRKLNDKGKWVYKYMVVDHLRPTTDGGIAYDENTAPEIDPLGLVAHMSPRLLAYYHDEARWLRLTALGKYPDCVVALSRHMLWSENLDEQEREHAPDLVVTARPGWCFGNEATPGTTHGYPFSDSMRPTLFISGPNVRRGARIEEPCRLADLTPTMLDMLGYQLETGDFDGHSLRNIFQPAPGSVAVNDGTSTKRVSHSEENADAPEHRAVYWDDLDLKAWNKLSYYGLPQYEHMPFTVHNPNSPLDAHNIAYNLLTISDINALGVLDTAISPLDGGRPVFTRSVEWAESKLRKSGIPALRDAEDALDVSTTTIGDYTPLTVGNFKRMDGVVDWIQNRLTMLDSLVARPFGRENTPGTVLVNKAVDKTQWWLWETYRFGERVTGGFLDEKVLNSIQDGADRSINHFRLQPAEIIVAPGTLPPNPAPPEAARTPDSAPATLVPPPAPPAQ